jgi:hypothetical protein
LATVAELGRIRSVEKAVFRDRYSFKKELVMRALIIPVAAIALAL